MIILVCALFLLSSVSSSPTQAYRNGSGGVHPFRIAAIDNEAPYLFSAFYPLGECVCIVVAFGVSNAVLRNVTGDLDLVFSTDLYDNDLIGVVQREAPCSSVSTDRCKVLIISAKQDISRHGEFKVLLGNSQTTVKYGPPNLSYQGVSGYAVVKITATNPWIILELRTTKMVESFFVCEHIENGWNISSDFNKPRVQSFSGCRQGTEAGGFSQPFEVYVSHMLHSFPFRSREVLVTSSSVCALPSVDTISIILNISVALTSTIIPTSTITTIIPVTPFVSPTGGPRETTSYVWIIGVVFLVLALLVVPALVACVYIVRVLYLSWKKRSMHFPGYAQEICIVSADEDQWSNVFFHFLKNKCGSVSHLRVSDDRSVLDKLQNSSVEMIFVRDRSEEANVSPFENVLSTMECQNSLHRIILVERDGPTPAYAQVPNAPLMRIEQIPSGVESQSAAERVLRNTRHFDLPSRSNLHISYWISALLKRMNGNVDNINEREADRADQNAMDELDSVQVDQD